MSSKEDEKEKKSKKKDRKERKKKNRKRGGKELNLEDDNGDEGIAWKEGKPDKNRKGRKSVTFADTYPFDQAYKGECVADALRVMFEGLEEHIADKAFYPKYVAHAVAKTVAQMVQMVCYSEMRWMKDWLTSPQGIVNTEWQMEEELELPPIDTWARAVIPMKQTSMPITFLCPTRSIAGQFKRFPTSQQQQQEQQFGKSEDGSPRLPAEKPPRPPLRRASGTTVLAHKKLTKCDHCVKFAQREASRRDTDAAGTAQQIKLAAGRVRRNMSSMLRDQAMLNKILKSKGLLPPPRKTKFEEHPRPPPPYFESY